MYVYCLYICSSLKQIYVCAHHKTGKKHSTEVSFFPVSKSRKINCKCHLLILLLLGPVYIDRIVPYAGVITGYTGLNR